MLVSHHRLLVTQLLALLAVAYPPVAQSWNPFGPRNYEDCVLDGIKNAKSDQAANAVIHACSQKFPVAVVMREAVENIT